VALPPNATNEAAECTTAKVQPQQPRGRTTMKANRIQELEKLATEVEHSHGAFGEYEKYYRLNTEKFAKLIVKECGLIVDELAGGQMGGASSYDLNKHFGVAT